MDVAAWLRDLGLSDLSTFRDNDAEADRRRPHQHRGYLGRPPVRAARRDCQPRHAGSDRQRWRRPPLSHRH
jgi:hypothetical protein